MSIQNILINVCNGVLNQIITKISKILLKYQHCKQVGRYLQNILCITS